MFKALIAFFVVMNLAGFAMMGIDKWKATKGSPYRIPEIELLALACFGGSIGCTVAMKWFRHKTKHLSFKIGLPVLSVLQVVLMIYLYLKIGHL